MTTRTETLYALKATHKITGESTTLGEITITTHSGSKKQNITADPHQRLQFSGIDAGFPELVVETTADSVSKQLKSLKRHLKQSKIQFFLTLKSIEKALSIAKEKDFLTMYEEQGEPWQNLMDDVMLYYCSRFLLFKTPMPIPHHPMP